MERLNALTEAVIGAAIEVHRHLGPGFLEATYEKAMLVELTARGIPHRSQVSVPVLYKGQLLQQQRIDLLVGEEVVVELKAVEQLLTLHAVQLRAYLRATGCLLGLLVNFNVPVLRDGLKRVIQR